MPVYPRVLPAFTALTNADHPQSSHLNAPNRELEAICRELGAKLKDVDDTVLPVPNPLTVVAYRNMLAYIVRTLAGTSSWKIAGVPSRGFVWGHGVDYVITTGATAYLRFMGSAVPQATEAYTRCYIPFACNIVGVEFQITTAQPGTGSLVATVRKNGADTAIVATHAASAAAMAVASASGSVAFAADDYLTVSIKNNAGANSAQIGSITVQTNQTG